MNWNQLLTFYLQHIVSDGEAAVAGPLDFGHTGELSILQLKMIVKEFPQLTSLMLGTLARPCRVTPKATVWLRSVCRSGSCMGSRLESTTTWHGWIFFLFLVGGEEEK